MNYVHPLSPTKFTAHIHSQSLQYVRVLAIAILLTCEYSVSLTASKDPIKRMTSCKQKEALMYYRTAHPVDTYMLRSLFSLITSS